MGVITRRATMLAGDRSRDLAEAKLRRSQGAISPASSLSESRNYPTRCFYTTKKFTGFDAKKYVRNSIP